jgi:hypothetical protein
MKNAYALLGKRRHGKPSSLHSLSFANNGVRIRCRLLLAG